MQSRLGELGLQSIDVDAGAGDCFFRSVSHQLYGNSNHPGGGTPLYGLYRYVPRNRVWFLEVLDP